ncbi:MAG: glycosyltransferase family 39 protein, partial [Proteobacteria bacterium]|nr:glycosyltransferase family 39 protein [Pseudomonadota bacterium]
MFLLLLIAILCLVPPISRDALVHHLAIPKIYISQTRIIELPCMIYSYFPMNLEILFGIALYLGSDIAPKFIHFFFGILTSVFIFNYLTARLDRVYALFGVLLFFTIPIIIKLCITAYVDLGLVFFSTAALFALFKWRDSKFNYRHLLISGFFCGMAMGTKYNGFITFILLIFSIFYLFFKDPGKKKGVSRLLIGLMLFVLSAAAVYSPWGVRNYIWTGNPVYPLYNSAFNINSENTCINSLELKNGENQNLSPLEYRRLIDHESWWEILLIPVRIFFEGKDNDFKYFDGKLTPVLFFLPMFAFVGILKTRNSIKHEKIVLLGYAVFFILISLSATVARIRYLAPAIPALVILSIFGIHGIVCFMKENPTRHIANKAGTIFILFVFIFQVVFCINYLVNQYNYVQPFPYLLGKISRQDYISSYRPEN